MRPLKSTAFALAVAAAAVCAAPALPLAAQAQAPLPTVEPAREPAAGTVPEVRAAPPTEAAPVARTAQPPRTLRAYWHLFIAFALTWVLLFGYTVWISGRLKALERELETLRA
jgi:CcmD family protein